jgi:virginiamycin B lyase
MRRALLLASTALAGLMTLPGPATAQVLLSGHVSSAEEGAMEGVLVSARQDGSTITTTVVSDNQGRYGFPPDRLEAGHYTITIRAANYALVGPKTVDLAPGTPSTADITLARTSNVAAQLSNAEWLQSVPGDARVKSFLPDCVNCHTLQRVFTAPHTADEWKAVFMRMARYSPLSVPTHPQLIVTGGPRSERPRVPAAILQQAADFLYSVNLSNPEHEEYGLKRLPRPKDRATHVVITEYDLPRKEALPHDVVIDPDGHAWYSDFGNQFVGELDPKTGKVSDYPIPVSRPDQPKGSLNLELDPDSNLWIGMAYQAGVAKIDRKSKVVTTYPLPKEWAGITTQTNMASASHMNVDGKVWTGDSEAQALYRLDVKSGQWENMGKAIDASGKAIEGYGKPTDKDNNVYLLEYGNMHIGKVDAKTHVTESWATPTLRSRPRRGRLDEAGHLWFGEYAGNAIGMLDTQTHEIKEWKMPTAYADPYDAEPTRDGREVWAGSMLTDEVVRLIPARDEIVEYLLPHSTNIRRVFVDESGPRPVLWVGNNHGAAIVKVEPLD